MKRSSILITGLLFAVGVGACGARSGLKGTRSRTAPIAPQDGAVPSADGPIISLPDAGVITRLMCSDVSTRVVGPSIADPTANPIVVWNGSGLVVAFSHNDGSSFAIARVTVSNASAVVQPVVYTERQGTLLAFAYAPETSEYAVVFNANTGVARAGFQKLNSNLAPIGAARVILPGDPTFASGLTYRSGEWTVGLGSTSSTAIVRFPIEGDGDVVWQDATRVGPVGYARRANGDHVITVNERANLNARVFLYSVRADGTSTPPTTLVAASAPAAFEHTTGAASTLFLIGARSESGSPPQPFVTATGLVSEVFPDRGRPALGSSIVTGARLGNVMHVAGVVAMGTAGSWNPEFVAVSHEPGRTIPTRFTSRELNPGNMWNVPPAPISPSITRVPCGYISAFDIEGRDWLFTFHADLS